MNESDTSPEVKATFVSAPQPAPLSDIERAELYALRQEKAARQERRIRDLEESNADLCARLGAIEAELAAAKAQAAAKAGKDAGDKGNDKSLKDKSGKDTEPVQNPAPSPVPRRGGWL